MFLLTEPAGARGGVEDILDPFARVEAEEAAESKREARPLTTEAQIARVLGAPCWRRRVTFLDVEKRVAATFWLVFDRPRVICDVLPRGLRKEQFEWRAEIARSHGFRYVAFVDGVKVEETELRRAAGKE